MKIYLLAILLILNPVMAFAGDYISDKEQNSLVWDNKPSSDTAVSWIGNLDENDFADGFGLAIWYKANNFQVGYFGTMQKGKFNGLVKSFDLTDNYRQGNWINGDRSSDWNKITDSSLKKLAKSDIDNLLKVISVSYSSSEEKSDSNNIYSFSNFLQIFNPSLLKEQKKNQEILSVSDKQKINHDSVASENVTNILSQLFEGESLFNKGKYSQIQIDAIFDESFKDKQVLVSGKITNISKSLSGEKYISLQVTDGHFFDVYPSADFNVLDYSKGQQASFVGKWTKIGTGVVVHHVIRSAVTPNS
jgi:hypothetical protein